MSEGKKALLIVDMLNEFLKDGGAMPFPRGRAIVAAVRRLTQACRAAEVPVIYLNDTHRPDRADFEFCLRTPHCMKGSWGAQIIADLEARPEDYVIEKRRYSGFFGTDLDTVLRELGVDTVIVTGVVTNICVRSTVHDAFFRGYRVIVPRQCVEATGEREQASTLHDIETHFGLVTDLDAVLDQLVAAARR